MRRGSQQEKALNLWSSSLGSTRRPIHRMATLKAQVDFSRVPLEWSTYPQREEVLQHAARHTGHYREVFQWTYGAQSLQDLSLKSYCDFGAELARSLGT